MMREDDDSSEGVALPPGFNEQRFATRIEQALGYEIKDPKFRDEIADEVYNPKPKAEFGFDPTVGGTRNEGSAPETITQPAPVGSAPAPPPVSAPTPPQEQRPSPPEPPTATKGYMEDPADQGEMDKQFGYDSAPKTESVDSGSVDVYEEDLGYTPFQQLDTVDEDSYDEPPEPEFKPSDRIKVALRLRPLNKEEMAAKGKKKKDGGPEAHYGWKIEEDSEYDVLVEKGVRKKSEGKSMFHVDRIYEEGDFIQALYSDVGEPILSAVMSGLHGIIFCYGATGGGKSHTIQGGKGADGIIQCAAKDLFDRIAKNTRREYTVKASYFEIYNEQVRDLKQEEEDNPKSRRATAVVTTVNKINVELPILNIREDSKTGEVYVDASETKVSNVENVIRVLHKGNRNRATEKTQSNKFSSRSHAIFRLTIESHERVKGGADSLDGIKSRVASINFVDLAGSENSMKAATSGSRKREGGKINQSLLSLSQVISQLSLPEKKRPSFINYRDSKLTRILQPQLSGNSAMAIVCCASRAKKCVEETRQTLKFAYNARRIKLKPKVNEVVDDKVLLKNLKRELHDTRMQLRQMQEYMKRNPPGSRKSKEAESEFPLIDRFVALMSASARTEDFVDAIESLSQGSPGGESGKSVGHGEESESVVVEDVNDDRGSGSPQPEEDDEDDVEAFRRQILAKFMSQAAEEEGLEYDENADTTMNETTFDGGETTDYDTDVNQTTDYDTSVNESTNYDSSVNRTYTDDTLMTQQTTDGDKDSSKESYPMLAPVSAQRNLPSSQKETKERDVFRRKPEDGLPMAVSGPVSEENNISNIPALPPSESDLNLIERFREEILEKFRDEIVDEEAAHELDENAQNVAVIANELINKFKREIVYKFKDDFPEILGKASEVDVSATRVGDGIVGRVIERVAGDPVTTEEESSGSDGSGSGSVEQFEDEFDEEPKPSDPNRGQHSTPRRSFSARTDGAIINGHGTAGLSTENTPVQSSIGKGSGTSVSSDLSSDVADRDKSSANSPLPANPPGDDDNLGLPPGEIEIGKALASGSIDDKMKIKFLREKLAATDELVETLFVELENAKTFIRELVFENAGGGIDQSGAALFGPGGTTGVTVVDEQILNQCEILKFAIYTSLLFFVFGQHELFLATVFFLWLSLEVATKT